MQPLKMKALEKCDLCGKEPKIRIPYGPHRFCKEHFNYFFEKRVRRNIRSNALIKHGEKIAAGVSGGKDSMVALHLLHKIYGNQIRLEAILIDEGIRGYRDASMQIGIDYCEREGIPYHTVSFREEFGIEMTDVMKKIHENQRLGSTCSFCGVFRRHFLNLKAKEIEADKLATGHNLDDEAQSIAMSLFRNDFARASRLGEIIGGKYEELVPRIKPLYDTPEKEIIAYAAFNGIGHYSEECCPYSWMAMRNHYRKMLNELEEAVPGSKYSLLASFRNLKPLLRQYERENSHEIMHCRKCGNPANSETCSVCSQLERIRGVEKTARKEPSSMKKKSGLTCIGTKRM